MKLYDITDGLIAHLGAVKRRLSGSETGEAEQRLEIDRIVRLHCEAELLRLTALVERTAAKGESSANSQYVTVLDFDCIAQQQTLASQPNNHKPFESKNHAHI